MLSGTASTIVRGTPCDFREEVLTLRGGIPGAGLRALSGSVGRGCVVLSASGTAVAPGLLGLHGPQALWG